MGQRRQWLLENFVSFALALLLVFMIRSSVVEAFKIPSGSMIPTLLIGDHIFVNKFAYGLKIPFSDLFTDHPVYLVKRDGPQHGDVIVFIYPKDESFYYIKRVIGIPGDTIEIRNRQLFINNQKINRDPIAPEQSSKILAELKDPKYAEDTLEIFTEHLDKKDHMMMLNKANNFMSENFGPINVPPDSLFVMGDNRDFSNDSRFWGFVPMKNVKGKAMIIWLSAWLNTSDFSQSTLKLNRIGGLIH